MVMAVQLGVVSAAASTAPQSGVFQDKGGAVFNVKAYGADGTQAKDDAAYASAYAAAVTAGGGTILFPEIVGGAYLTNGLTINDNRIGLRFEGGSYLKAAPGCSIVLAIGNTASVANCFTERLRIDGNNVAGVVGFQIRSVGGGQTNTSVFIETEVDNCPGGAYDFRGIGNNTFVGLITSNSGSVANTKPAFILTGEGAVNADDNTFINLDCETAHYQCAVVDTLAISNHFFGVVLDNSQVTTDGLVVYGNDNDFTGLNGIQTSNQFLINFPTKGGSSAHRNSFTNLNLAFDPGASSGALINLVNSAGAAGFNKFTNVAIQNVPAGCTGIIDSMGGRNAYVGISYGTVGGTKYTITNTVAVWHDLDGTDRLDGLLNWVGDANYNIGAVASGRPNNVYVANTIFVSGSIQAVNGASIINDEAAQFIRTSVALTNGAGSSAGTLTNAPAAGNPTKWIGILDNGVLRYIPAW